jgi:hypothetical protein
VPLNVWPQFFASDGTACRAFDPRAVLGRDAAADLGPLTHRRLRHAKEVCQRGFAADDRGGFRKGMGRHAVSVDFLHMTVNTFYPNE